MPTVTIMVIFSYFFFLHHCSDIYIGKVLLSYEINWKRNPQRSMTHFDVTYSAVTDRRLWWDVINDPHFLRRKALDFAQTGPLSLFLDKTVNRNSYFFWQAPSSDAASFGVFFPLRWPPNYFIFHVEYFIVRGNYLFVWFMDAWRN